MSTFTHQRQQAMQVAASIPTFYPYLNFAQIWTPPARKVEKAAISCMTQPKTVSCSKHPEAAAAAVVADVPHHTAVCLPQVRYVVLG